MTQAVAIYLRLLLPIHSNSVLLAVALCCCNLYYLQLLILVAEFHCWVVGAAALQHVHGSVDG